MEEKVGVIETQFQDIKKFASTKVNTMEEKINIIEKEIQWRITDCEQLLKSRVNETYVRDYGAIIEDRVL